MKVDWRGKIEPNHTSSGCSLMKVDWGGNLEPNHSSSACMLMQVDSGGKFRVNHISELRLSEVDWGGHDPSLYPMDACMLSELIGELMTQVSSFTLSTLTMMETQMTSSLKDYGENYHKEHLPPLSLST